MKSSASNQEYNFAFDSVNDSRLEEEELSALCSQLERQEKELRELLAGEAAKRYEACLELRRRVLLQTEQESFFEGVRMGIHLASGGQK